MYSVVALCPAAHCSIEDIGYNIDCLLVNIGLDTWSGTQPLDGNPSSADGVWHGE